MTATAVHSLWTSGAWTSAAGPVDKISTPHIEYAQISPVLVVLGAAILGILVEAF